MSSSFVEIEWRGKRVRIEHAFIAPTLSHAQGERDSGAPLLVFLHEGLGSLAMWQTYKDARAVEFFKASQL